MVSVEFFHTIERLQAPIVMLTYWLLYKLETRDPLREQSWKSQHYWHNVGLNVLNFILIGIFSHFIVEYAHKAQELGWGLFHVFGIGGVLFAPFQVVVYDFLSYWIHRLFHSVDALWSLHRCHHSDGMMDATTAFRFHPGEGVIRMALQSVFIVLLGMSPWAIVLHSLIAAPIFLISHANWKLNSKTEVFWARVFVLPRDHSIHHHPARRFHDSNYGAIFMFWDHLFGTYTAPSKVRKFYVGLTGYKPDATETVGDLLMDPLQNKQEV